MSATLVSSLPPQDSPIFAGNLPDISFAGIDPLEGMAFELVFNFFTGSPLKVLDEIIFPDADGKATLQIRHVVEASLQHQYPSSDMFAQSSAASRMSIVYDGATYHLYVIKGGILIPEDQYGTYDYEAFFGSNLLSWSPPDRKVKYTEPCFLNYFNFYSGGQLYAKAYFITNTDTLGQQEYPIYSGLTVNQLFTFNVSFNQLVAITGAPETVFAFDCYVVAGGITTNKQRLTLINSFDEHDDIFAFANSLGGFDSMRLTGQLSESPNHAPVVFKNNHNQYIEYEVNPEILYKKHTGYFNDDESKYWLRDFFSSSFRFHLRVFNDQYIPERITLTSQSGEAVKYTISSLDFTFKYANPVAWQLHTRPTLSPVGIMDAVTPGSVGVIIQNESN